MKTTYVLIAIVVVVVILLKSLVGTSRSRSGRDAVFTKKRLLTDREQSMFHRLQSSLPDFTVLAQVSFGALLMTSNRADRNRFDRKIADFVICNKAFIPIAVVELDDASHKSKTDADSTRDAMLTQAGYRVVRYSNIPDVEKVRADFIASPPPVKTPSRAPRIDPS